MRSWSGRNSEYPQYRRRGVKRSTSGVMGSSIWAQQDLPDEIRFCKNHVQFQIGTLSLRPDSPGSRRPRRRIVFVKRNANQRDHDKAEHATLGPHRTST